MTTPETESISYIRIAIACGIVGSLLAALGYVLKFLNDRSITWSSKGFHLQRQEKLKRLAIVESLPLDIKRRLVIVRCDKQEHLLLLGLNKDMVVGINLDSHKSQTPHRAPPKSP